MIQRLMNADDFVNNRADLPDAGQWAELIRGVPKSLQPPDSEHGTIVLNLSKAFADFVTPDSTGYPCFDLGLRVERRPDTLFFPAACYFESGPRFSEADNEYTDTVPALIIELITTPDRRNSINERSGRYIEWGVKMIWVIDAHHHIVHQIEKGNPVSRRFEETDIIQATAPVAGFTLPVQDLFKEPDWS